MKLVERIILFVTRVAAFRARKQGGLSVERHRQFKALLLKNPRNEDLGQTFRDCLIETIAIEAELAGVVAFNWDGDVPTGIREGGLIDLLNWIIENWAKIAEIILFIMGLFI